MRELDPLEELDELGELGELKIHRMGRDEVDIAIDWAAKEGWNPGVHDAECFYRTDPGGFFLGLLDGEPVATISAVAYGDRYGFLGFYIVSPRYRGRGLGPLIWRAALDHLGSRTVGLDAVVEQEPVYEGGGFRAAFGSVRYQGTGIGGGSSKSVPLSELSFDQLAAYDDRLFSFSRHAFLRCWTGQPDSSSLGAIRDCDLAGYGVIRRCGIGYKIGPLYADDAEIALSLLDDLRASVPAGEPVFLDVPGANPAAVALAEEHHMEPVFQTVRMYLGKEPVLPLERWFGVTSFELG